MLVVRERLIGCTLMRMRFPKRRPNHGIWGGFGSKAPEKVWQPPTTTPTGKERIPAKHRRVRLRKIPLLTALRRGEKATAIDYVLATLSALAGLVIILFTVYRLTR